MDFLQTINKEDLSLLPIEEFPGRVIVVDTERDTEKAISYLSTFKEVGFDTETRPNFRKGQSNKISLMQISTEDTCFLFRLNHIGIPEALEHFLSDASIQKIGLSLRDDLMLFRNGANLNQKDFWICKITLESMA